MSVQPEPEPEEVVEQVGAALSGQYIKDPETGSSDEEMLTLNEELLIQ